MKWTDKEYPAIHMTAASRDEFPSVTLDNDATQKFAEIRVQWGEYASLRFEGFFMFNQQTFLSHGTFSSGRIAVVFSCSEVGAP